MEGIIIGLAVDGRGINMTDASAIILAGGKSSRMGTDKALIRVKENGMLEDAVKSLGQAFPEIIVSTNLHFFNNSIVKTVADLFPQCGPLGGIHAGLMVSGHHLNFLTACDMPFIDNRLAVYMIELAAGFDVVVPKLDNYYQPLFAVYSRNCLGLIEKQLRSGYNKITGFYKEVKIRYLGYDQLRHFGDPEKMFFNVNTPLDLDMAKEMAGSDSNGSQV